MRDSRFTLYALLSVVMKEEAACWFDWLVCALAGTPDQLSIMYGLFGEHCLTQMELPWLLR